ncbi:F-box/FBD/LRR-repeat protein At5g22700-like [Lolium perenne]|uniref:F-box/FBD/LRR-repeat protein At5g22700-like n=1 Tax=Lolium perenne TaxID=4522 RepID=UPI0021F5CF93|nr:putative FBD-associated F-box protein At1g55030 [Lolium perenne]
MADVQVPGHVRKADLISALPDDLLLQVLGRLPLTAAAARTSLLSRRWRGLWTRLPNITFRDVALDRLGWALASLRDAALGPGVPFLDIAFDSLQAAAGVSLLDDGLQKRVLAGLPSLLHAAAGLSPVEFHLALPRRLDGADVELPRFHRATSIHLHALNLRLTLPPSTGGFPKLETLSLSGYCVDLAALVRHCPCLRVLRVTKASLGADINIRSESLQELFLRTNETRRWIDSINVEAPKLKRLTLLFGTDTGARLSVSIMTPLLEKASWWCLYATKSTGLAPWGLSMVRLYPAESLGAGEDTWSSQLSNVNVLSLEMKARGPFHAQLNFQQQIEKHLVADFSILELTMVYDDYWGSQSHGFGP